MVLATHVIFSAYGFWLPNDPRGSWSDFVAAWELLLAGGKTTKAATRRSVAHDEHDCEARLRAKEALKYPAVEFTGTQALSVIHGFSAAIQESDYRVFACSILPAHVHMVIGRHRLDAKRIVGHLKGRASQALEREGLHPLAAFRSADGSIPTPWGRKSWEVFLNERENVARAVEYVEQNPVKEGKKRQERSFVLPYRRN